MLYLNFDDGTGDTARDLSGYGNDGVLQGSPTWTAGRFGGGLEFDGNNYVDIPYAESIDVGDGDFSIEVWFKYEEAAEAGSLVWAYNVGGGEPQIWIRTHPKDNNITGLVWDGVVPDGPIVETPSAYNDNQWHYLAFVYEAKALGVYVDGELVGEAEANEGSASVDAYGIHLGQRVDGDNRYIGVLDEFRLWTRALSESEISANGAGPPTAVHPTHHLAATWGSIKEIF